MTENKIISIGGIDCYEKDGTAYLKLETVARGLGFKQEKNGIEYVRWETVNSMLSGIGFSQQVGKDDYIPENVFYRLAMKAKNETAEKFQAFVADEVIPSIRKTGSYNVKPLSPAEMFLAQAQLNVEHEHRLSALEENQRRLVEVCGIPSIGRDEWQIKMKERISDLCQQYDLEYKSTYDELYRELEDKTGCNVESRRRNLRKRLRKAGATCKERDNVSKLMVVSKDLALATAFEGIVQRFAARIVSENM